MSKRRAERLAALLKKTGSVDEFVVVERTGERSSVTSDVSFGRRRADVHHLEATVYRDVRRGRGSATFVLPDHDVDAAQALIAAAISRAEDAAGPAWKLPPPAAPARVSVDDPSLGDDLLAHADTLAQELSDAVGMSPLQLGASQVDVERIDVTVITSSGFSNSYTASDLRIAAIVTSQHGRTGTAERVHAHVRTLDDLDLARRVADAATRMRDRAAAVALEPGAYDVALVGPSLTLEVMGSISTNGSDHEQYGWFGPIVAQSSASMARQRLTRYQPGQSIYERDVTGDVLTVSSDGTLPFGIHSRPFGDLGEPVRKFPLVDRGVASGLSLDLREAALRGVNSNGGVRNLVVAPGTTAAAELMTADQIPLLEIAELGWLETNPRTGGFVAELGLGYLSGPAGQRAAVIGGTLRGSVFDVFAGARFSSERSFHGWYDGPTVIRLSNVSVR